MRSLILRSAVEKTLWTKFASKPYLTWDAVFTIESLMHVLTIVMMTAKLGKRLAILPDEEAAVGICLTHSHIGTEESFNPEGARSVLWRSSKGLRIRLNRDEGGPESDGQILALIRLSPDTSGACDLLLLSLKYALLEQCSRAAKDYAGVCPTLIWVVGGSYTVDPQPSLASRNMASESSGKLRCSLRFDGFRADRELADTFVNGCCLRLALAQPHNGTH